MNDISDASTLGEQLESALTHGEFELYYQPLIDVRDHSMHGLEALLRWNHPTRGLLNPSEFVGTAEESGAIVAIGRWVLYQACADHRHLQQFSRKGLLLSVNVSARQLEEPTFLCDLADILRETGLDPRLLQLEITESIFLQDSLRIGALFHSIRALGVRIAFDDFGTGYSSLSYLASYPVDLLKIDQCFVKRMHESHTHADVVHLIVDLAHTFGLHVSAEGVENHNQARALSEIGCNVVQGYLYSPPLPLSALSEVIQPLSEAPTDEKRQPRPHGFRSLLRGWGDSVTKCFADAPSCQDLLGSPAIRSAALRSGPGSRREWQESYR